VPTAIAAGEAAAGALLADLGLPQAATSRTSVPSAALVQSGANLARTTEPQQE
jgi:hypothetical protein